MILNNRAVLEKIRAFFHNPVGFPDLPDYIVAQWKFKRDDDFKTAEELDNEKHLHGAIFKTSNLEDLRQLYMLLTHSEVRNLRLYQITPERIVFLLGYLGVKV